MREILVPSGLHSPLRTRHFYANTRESFLEPKIWTIPRTTAAWAFWPQAPRYGNWTQIWWEIQGRCECEILGSKNCSAGASHLRSVPECPSPGCCQGQAWHATGFLMIPFSSRPRTWPLRKKPEQFPAVKLSPETQGLVATSLASEKFPMERLTKLQKKLLGQTHKHTETWPQTFPWPGCWETWERKTLCFQASYSARQQPAQPLN